MESSQYLAIFGRLWRLLVLVTIGTAALALLATLLVVTPRYTAATRLYFGTFGGGSLSEISAGATYTESQMASYAEIARSPLVLDPVIAELGLPADAQTLAGRVTATVPLDTAILELTVSDTDARRAAATADALAGQVSRVVAELTPRGATGSRAVRATTLTSAKLPIGATSPDVFRNLVLGLLLGFVLGLAVVVARHLFDPRIRDQQDLVRLTDRPLLGVIPFEEMAAAHPIAMLDTPSGRRAEAVRRLRTNLQAALGPGGGRTVVLTSSTLGEGKSTTAVNLALALAATDTKVLLVDADLRRPSITNHLNLDDTTGLTAVLTGKMRLESAVQRWPQTKLDVLPAGLVPDNPSELLGSSAMSEVLSKVSRSYQLVLLIASPLSPMTDAAVLSEVAAGAVLVVDIDKTHRSQVRQSLESLRAADAGLLGLVLNKVPRSWMSSFGFGDDGRDTSVVEWAAVEAEGAQRVVS